MLQQNIINFARRKTRDLQRQDDGVDVDGGGVALTCNAVLQCALRVDNSYSDDIYDDADAQ